VALWSLVSLGWHSVVWRELLIEMRQSGRNLHNLHYRNFCIAPRGKS
jgi:hypothetical protein